MHKRLLVVLTMLLAASCGRSATPSSEPVQASVQVTPTTQLAATVTVTPTLPPAVTPTPPATLTVTLTPDLVPAGWTTYQFIGAPFIAVYPPDWEIYGEGVKELVLKHSQDTTYLLSISHLGMTLNSAYDTTLSSSYDLQVRTLKQVWLELGEPPGGVGLSKFIGEGMLDTPQHQAYVIVSKQGSPNIQALITMVLNGDNEDNAALIMFARVGSFPSPEGTAALASRIASYIRWR